MRQDGTLERGRQVHEIDPTPAYGPTSYARDASLARFVVSPAVDGWSYRFSRAAGRRRGGVSARLEIGAQLEGGWRQRGAVGGDGLYAAGEVHVLDPGEAYDLAFRGSGRVLGLSVDLDRLAGWHDASRELVVTPAGKAATRPLFELCRALADGRLAADEVERALARWVEGACEATPASPLVAARRELERHYAQDLYLRHVAEAAGMRPETFLRGFARRYGMTPIQYRIRLRLNAAARRGWLEPERPLHEIARDEGFSSLSYFHRAFRAYFGASPAMLRDTHR
jgi:AraC-like DNA-binding protein